MKTTTPAFLMGLYYSSIPIAGSLGGRGITVFGIDNHRSAIGASSRYVTYLPAPADPDKLKYFLAEFAVQRDLHPVLMPLSDYFILFLAEKRAFLSEHYSFVLPGQDVLTRLLSKTQSGALLAELGIGHPKTIICRKGTTASSLSENVVFPCILKPMYKHNWEHRPDVARYAGEGMLVLHIDDAAHLREALQTLSPISDLIIQEFIPGPSTSYIYYVGYRDRSGAIVTSYLGQKIRTVRECLGSETLLRSIHDPELLAYGDDILHRLDYRGPAGIDFKYDERDGRYKVIEINCRVGINDCYMMKYGIDLPYVYYLDSQDIEVTPVREYPDGVTWYDPFRDLDWMRLYRREKNIGWGSWLRELPRYDTYALLHRSDPWPFTKSILELIGRGIGKLNPFRQRTR